MDTQRWRKAIQTPRSTLDGVGLTQIREGELERGQGSTLQEERVNRRPGGVPIGGDNEGMP